MIIDQSILDDLTAQAKASPRLRMNLDLRNSPADQSQRMLNAIEPGSPMPIHRHMKSSETVVCLRGHFVEYFYDADGRMTDAIDMVPGGTLINIPIDQWHNLESLESGTVLLECKDGSYEPLGEEEIFVRKQQRINVPLHHFQMYRAQQNQLLLGATLMICWMWGGGALSKRIIFNV